MTDQGDRFWRGLVAGVIVSSGLVGGALAAWHRLRSTPDSPAGPDAGDVPLDDATRSEAEVESGPPNVQGTQTSGT
jgi:hypothetical protein